MSIIADEKGLAGIGKHPQGHEMQSESFPFLLLLSKRGFPLQAKNIYYLLAKYEMLGVYLVHWKIDTIWHNRKSVIGICVPKSFEFFDYTLRLTSPFVATRIMFLN